MNPIETGEIRDLEVKVDRFGDELAVLRQAFEVHTTAETGHRALQLERIENLRLSMQNAALVASSEIAQRYESRLSTIEHKAIDHIETCRAQNAKDDQGVRDRQIGIVQLKNGIIILAITQVMQVIGMVVGYLVLK